jgi:hypothetical protein
MTSIQHCRWADICMSLIYFCNQIQCWCGANDLRAHALLNTKAMSSIYLQTNTTQTSCRHFVEQLVCTTVAAAFILPSGILIPLAIVVLVLIASTYLRNCNNDFFYLNKLRILTTT